MSETCLVLEEHSSKERVAFVPLRPGGLGRTRGGTHFFGGNYLWLLAAGAALPLFDGATRDEGAASLPSGPGLRSGV